MAHNNKLTVSKEEANDNLTNFVHSFYSYALDSELKNTPRDKLIAKAGEVFQFLQKKLPGKPKIEVTLIKDAENPRTEIKVLNDDKSFLVDSVIAEIGRLNYKIYEIYHPVLKIKRDKTGKFLDFSSAASAESLIYVQISYSESKQSA